jgi:hypothetical protein
LKPLHLYILILLLLNIILPGAGYLLNSIIHLDIVLSDIGILTILFSIIALITIFIFLRGQTKEPDSQALHSLVSISLKFLLEMVLAVIWFIVAKKTSLSSVLMFFVIYLSLTLYSILIILKTLRNKSLLN